MTISNVGSLTLNAGEELIPSSVIDITNGFAYFGTWTGGVLLNTITGWGTLNVEKLFNTARAGVTPLLSVFVSAPYMLAQPLFQLFPRPERETIRIQIRRT